MLVLIAALIAGIFLSLRSCGEKKPEKKPEEVKTGSGLLAAREDAGEAYLSQILFVGDSITIGLSEYHILPEKQVLGKGGINHKQARSQKVEYGGKNVRIPDAVGQQKPKVAVVSFGINGMGVFSEDEFMREYKGLMRDIRNKSPGTILVVQSVYPVSEGYGYEKPESNNKVIDSYNVKLIQMARDEGYYFLNTCEVLKDKEGALAKRFDAGDGLHINVEAYKEILTYVREHPVPEALAGLKPADSEEEEDASASPQDDGSSSSDTDESASSSSESGSSGSSSDSASE